VRVTTKVVAAAVAVVAALAAGDRRARSGTMPSVFLCYSQFAGAEPGVWEYTQAETLYRPADPSVGFYFRPYALGGTAIGGTNLGRWHLVCSLASPPQSYLSSYGDSHEYVGGSGELYDATTGAAIVRTLYPADALGMYPVWRLFPCGCQSTPR